MKVVDSTASKEEFVFHVSGQMDEFKEHVSRIKIQFCQMKKLKENLPKKPRYSTYGLCRKLPMQGSSGNPVCPLEPDKRHYTFRGGILQGPTII